MRTLPAEPLVRAVRLRYPMEERSDIGSNDGYQLMGGLKCGLPDRIQRAFYRARQAGWVSLKMADEIACAAGMHPCEVWGDDWWTE